ncbi:MAG: ABC transporter permease [Caldilineae bacterium]|nr:MAG: ABC transporter permease [Caldilineae bacterium]
MIAYRDLGRNRRRSFLTMLAVALGLALLMVMNGFVAGTYEDVLQNSIRLETGHVQIRAASYPAEKISLQWADLLESPDALAAEAARMPEVQVATPVLRAGAILATADETAGLQLMGVDVNSPFFDPFREALVAGEFPAPDDRSGIVLGRYLANSLGIQVGDKVNLALINANGQPDEAVFTVRGIFATGIFVYDEGTVFMPLSKAQAFTGAGERASAILILLNRRDDAGAVVAALQKPGLSVLTWEELNEVFLQTLQAAIGFYVILDGIVMLIVAVIIANTLLMSVFERVREMGILAALGMKGRQILLMFLVEAFILGLVGVVFGFGLGSLGVSYLSTVGYPVGEEIASAAGNIPIGSVMYAHFATGTFLSLALWTLIFTLGASLYPAWFAARLEPVEALRAL